MCSRTITDKNTAKQNNPCYRQGTYVGNSLKNVFTTDSSNETVHEQISFSKRNSYDANNSLKNVHATNAFNEAVQKPDSFSSEQNSYCANNFSKNVHSVSDVDKHSISTLLRDYGDVFKDELGALKGVQGKLYLKPDSVPVFCRARSVPFSLRGKVSNEIDRMVNLGIMYPVSHSDWATPVVPVPKKDGTVRLCGDFKVTLNKFLNCEKYPLPKIDEIFADISRGKFFSKLDLKNAYLQLVMDEEAQKLLTINTQKGLYGLTRCIYGVSSSRYNSRSSHTMGLKRERISPYHGSILH